MAAHLENTELVAYQELCALVCYYIKGRSQRVLMERVLGKRVGSKETNSVRETSTELIQHWKNERVGLKHISGKHLWG